MAKEKAKKAAKGKKKTSKKKEIKKKPLLAAEKEQILEAPEEEEEKAPETEGQPVPGAVEGVEEEQPQAAPAPKRPQEPEILYSATGKRKTCVARVKLVPGSGNIIVNKKPLIEYLSGRKVLEKLVVKPMILTDTKSKYDAVVKVAGGGVSGQAGAISHGISKALLELNPDFRARLKPEGLLTRDPRMKERKKYGRKKARKSFQYSKR